MKRFLKRNFSKLNGKILWWRPPHNIENQSLMSSNFSISKIVLLFLLFLVKLKSIFQFYTSKFWVSPFIQNNIRKLKKIKSKESHLKFALFSFSRHNFFLKGMECLLKLSLFLSFTTKTFYLNHIFLVGKNLM